MHATSCSLSAGYVFNSSDPEESSLGRIIVDSSLADALGCVRLRISAESIESLLLCPLALPERSTLLSPTAFQTEFSDETRFSLSLGSNAAPTGPDLVLALPPKMEVPSPRQHATAKRNPIPMKPRAKMEWRTRLSSISHVWWALSTGWKG